MVSCHDKHRRFTIVLAIPGLKIYAWCRCKFVDKDGSESHHHWHALVHFQRIKLLSWKKQAQRTKEKFSSSKNTFKKIICLDHVVGVLRYLTCSNGQYRGKSRDRDGLFAQPHTHYSRQSIDENHRHNRGKQRPEIRDEISKSIAFHVNLGEKLNWDELSFHDNVSCTCDRGDIGKKKREEANEKRRAFYKTDAGIEVRRKYQDKTEAKARLIDEVCKSNVCKTMSLDGIARHPLFQHAVGQG